ncbi:MAG: hypothetical protein EOP04_22965, partial [Proteobacteria bacterium]
MNIRKRSFGIEPFAIILFSVLILVFGIASIKACNSLSDHQVRMQGIQNTLEVNERKLPAWGQIGDSFGSFNAQFGLLTIIGLFISFVVSWFAMYIAKQNGERQESFIETQGFETSFYNQLNLFIATREVVLSLSTKKGETGTYRPKGRPAFVDATFHFFLLLEAYLTQNDSAGLSVALQSKKPFASLPNLPTYRQAVLIISDLIESTLEFHAAHPRQGLKFLNTLRAVLSE